MADWGKRKDGQAYKKTSSSKMKKSGSTQSSGMKLKSTKTVRQKKLPSVSISEENWQLDIRDDGTIELGLGNWTDAGWRWTGDSEEMTGYLVRLANSSLGDVDSILEENGITFNDLKKIAIKNQNNKDIQDGLYQISGDNVRWHFGEGEVDSSYLFDDYFEVSTEKNYSKEEKEKIYSETWNQYNTPSFDDFIEDYGKDLRKDLKDALNESNNIDDFDEKTKNIKDNADEDYFGLINSNFSSAIANAEKKLLKEKEITGDN